MKRNVSINKKLEEYKKRYSYGSDKLLIISKKEVETFDKKNREYKYKDKTMSLENNLILKHNKWWLIEDKYYQIPKAFTPTWFKTLTLGGKVASGAVATLLVGAIVTISALAISGSIKHKSDIDRVNEINEKINKNEIKTTKDFVDKFGELNALKVENPDDEYAFDVKNKQVVIISKNTNEVSYAKEKVSYKSDIFRFKDEYTFESEPNLDTYSTYLNSNYKGDGKITFNSGLDVGAHKDTELTYAKTAKSLTSRSASSISFSEDNKKEVYVPMVVTNYGTLNVNGPSNSISHYGILNSLTVTSLSKTYNEYGTVAGNVILKSGTFKAQEDSVINTIVIESSGAKVEVDDNSDTGSIAATKVEYLENITISEKKSEEVEVVEDPIPAPKTGDLEGLGTERSPYIIDDILTQSPKISEKYAKYNYYFYAGSEKEVEASSWAYNGKEMKLRGQFDCNGLILNNLDSHFINYLGTYNDDENHVSKISNLTINANISRAETAVPVVRTAGNHVELNNITVHGFIAGGGASSFIGYGANNFLDTGTDMFCTLNNCYSDATLINTNTQIGSAASFFVHPYCNPKTSLITINDSIFNGTITYPESRAGSSIPYTRYFVGTQQNYVRIKTSYSYAFTSKYGNIEGDYYETPTSKDDDGCFYVGSYPETSEEVHVCHDAFLHTERTSTVACVNHNEVAQAKNVSELASVSADKAENAVIAVAALYIAPNNSSGTGSYLDIFKKEEIDVSSLETGESFSTDELKNFRIRVNKDGVTEQGVHGYEFDVYDGPDHFYYVPKGKGETLDLKEYSGAYIGIVQYDSNGKPLQIDHFGLTKPQN